MIFGVFLLTYPTTALRAWLVRVKKKTLKFKILESVIINVKPQESIK